MQSNSGDISLKGNSFAPNSTTTIGHRTGDITFTFNTVITLNLTYLDNQCLQLPWFTHDKQLSRWSNNFIIAPYWKLFFVSIASRSTGKCYSNKKKWATSSIGFQRYGWSLSWCSAITATNCSLEEWTSNLGFETKGSWIKIKGGKSKTTNSFEKWSYASWPYSSVSLWGSRWLQCT